MNTLMNCQRTTSVLVFLVIALPLLQSCKKGPTTGDAFLLSGSDEVFPLADFPINFYGSDFVSKFGRYRSDLMEKTKSRIRRAVLNDLSSVERKTHKLVESRSSALLSAKEKVSEQIGKARAVAQSDYDKVNYDLAVSKKVYEKLEKSDPKATDETLNELSSKIRKLETESDNAKTVLMRFEMNGELYNLQLNKENAKIQEMYKEYEDHLNSEENNLRTRLIKINSNGWFDESEFESDLNSMWSSASAYLEQIKIKTTRTDRFGFFAVPLNAKYVYANYHSFYWLLKINPDEDKVRLTESTSSDGYSQRDFIGPLLFDLNSLK